MVDRERCEIIVGAFNGNSHGEHAYMSQAEAMQLQVLPIRENSAFDRQVISQILESIDRLSIDILHTHDFRSDLFGLWCAKKANIPIVSTCHGWIANNFKGKVYTRLDRFMLRFFDRVITVSDVMREQLLDRGVKDDRLRVIPNALVIDDYRPDKSRQAFRQELGLSPNTRLIANIGRLSPEKGQDIFLRAARQLLETNHDLCFVLIGIGPQQDYLQQLARQLGIASSVVFAGYRQDMQEIYNSLDLVVQSSCTEGMPNVILESLLMQVPVVATRVGGTEEVVQHGFSGLLIDANNLPQLVAGIADFLHSPQRHRDMVDKGREYVMEHFDHNRRVNRLMDVYEQVAEQTEKGG
jgi:glycosyltransferase involved in cell wall biosynthesis